MVNVIRRRVRVIARLFRLNAITFGVCFERTGIITELLERATQGEK